MKPRIHFILGLAMLTVAATLAVTISTRERNTPTHESADDSPRPSTAPHTAGSPLTPASPSHPTASANTTSLAPPDERFTVSIDPAHPDRQELEQRATRVERFARDRLERLTRELSLSVEQQHKMFPRLVEASQSYDPAMKVTGVLRTTQPVNVVTDPGDIFADLEPPQRDELTERSVDDLLLWQSIIAHLERQLDREVPVPEQPASPVPTSTEPPQADPADAGGRSNLFEIAPHGR